RGAEGRARCRFSAGRRVRAERGSGTGARHVHAGLPATGEVACRSSALHKAQVTMSISRSAAPFMASLVLACASSQPPVSGAEPEQVAATGTVVVRTNQIGHLPDGRKVAVVCALDESSITDFIVRDESGRNVLGPLP